MNEWTEKTTSRTRSARPRRRRGFTLIEVLVASAIMGLAFLALLEAFRTGLQMLEYSQRVTVGSSLAEEVHQMSLALPLADPQDPSHWGLETGESAPFDDVDDLDGRVFAPPVNADGAVITGLEDYRQEVTVVSVSDGDFDQVVADGTSGVCRVTVRVTCQGTEVSQMSWLAVDQP